MFAQGMLAQNKILLLDDDEQMLELYQALLEQIPSHPQVEVCNSGARAIAMLESEPFNMLITDLRMPKMDGLQVLAIVRRKFPLLRLVALTGVPDEEYRSRAYAQGVEMFWQKPASAEDIQLFQDCIESMLDRPHAAQEGFRGVQSKSLVDLIQLECLSRSSSVSKPTPPATPPTPAAALAPPAFTTATTATASKTWDPAFLDKLTQLLAPHIGPIAKVVVNRAAKAARNESDLCQTLAAEIPSEADRKRFLGMCR